MATVSMKDYLKRYQSDDADKKKKKKKPKPTATNASQVLIVDEDPVWQKAVQIEEEPESSGDEQPQVDEDIEVKRMKRLEALRARKPYHGISEDGSGWVSVSDPAKQSVSGAEKGSEDLSPPRARRRIDTSSPRRQERSADEGNDDLSPPRQRRRRADTPSEPDLSPPRQRRRRADTASSDPGDKRGASGSGDLSPLRQRRRNAEASPEHGLISDLSPPRQRRRQADTPSPEPGTKMGREQVDKASRRRAGSEDMSPPRRGQRSLAHVADRSPARQTRNADAEDLSPPRRGPRRSIEHEDLSPPRRSHKEPAGDISPPRRNSKDSPDDLSPPRRGHREGGISQGSAADLSPKRKVRKEASLTKESKRAGLFSAKEIKEEIDKKRKEESSRFAALDALTTGEGAAPVFRDKEGKRITKEELLKKKEEEKPKEKKLEWGKGLAQKREAEARAKDIELEKEKPFARTRDDPELDKMLKERLRWGDPMAHLVKRKNPELALEDLGDDEKMKESGFIIPQAMPSHSWIKRGIDFPPNRYGIRPGRHWDGVDRSNGFEKEMFKRQNEKQATEREAYLWSVSDM